MSYQRDSRAGKVELDYDELVIRGVTSFLNIMTPTWPRLLHVSSLPQLIAAGVNTDPIVFPAGLIVGDNTFGPPFIPTLNYQNYFSWAAVNPDVITVLQDGHYNFSIRIGMSAAAGANTIYKVALQMRVNGASPYTDIAQGLYTTDAGAISHDSMSLSATRYMQAGYQISLRYISSENMTINPAFFITKLR